MASNKAIDTRHEDSSTRLDDDCRHSVKWAERRGNLNEVSKKGVGIPNSSNTSQNLLVGLTM
jgi:hypothetical protein